MGRTIGGIAAGIVASFGTVWIIEMIAHYFYPVPAELNIGDPEQIGAYIRAMPGTAQAMVVAAWFFGALFGGIVAARIIGRDWAAWLMAGLVALAGILNIVMIPHPGWMQLAAVVAPLLGGLIASRAPRGPPRADPIAEDGAVADAEI